uniref:C2H2-type domain-containing protein n=1 Tax=Oncorhynchus mykiss TaxID=8022 RepID=A0A8C7U4N7_ONCMY
LLNMDQLFENNSQACYLFLINEISLCNPHFKPTEMSSLENDSSLGDTDGLNTDPSPRDTDSNVEHMRAALPGSNERDGHESQKNSNTTKRMRSKETKCFKCDVCEKTFSRKNLLVQHKLTHTRPFKCDVCEKTFSRKGSLEAHKLIHTLVHQMLIHTEERPFTCGQCGKTFRMSKQLEHHMLRHREKTFRSMFMSVLNCLRFFLFFILLCKSLNT